MSHHADPFVFLLRRAIVALACAGSVIAAAQNAPGAAASAPLTSAASSAASAASAASGASAASAPAAPLPVPPAVTPTPSAALTSRLYGILDVAAGRFQQPGQRRVLGLQAGAMQHGFVGFRGGDDLGGGLKARFGLEAYVSVNSGNATRFTGDPFFGRTAYVGFQGQFGTSLVGRLPTPLYTLTRQFNPFDESYGFSPSIRQWYQGTILGDSRWNNSLGYSSPDPDDGRGWSWQIQYTADDPGGAHGHNVGANLLYTSGPLMVGGAWQRVMNGFLPVDVLPAGFDHQTAYQLGMSYELRALRLYGQVGRVKTSAAGAVRARLYQLGAAAPVGLGFALVSYGHARTEADAYSSLRRTFSIGYDHFLSKNTDLYALAMNERVTGLTSANAVAAGIRLRF